MTNWIKVHNSMPQHPKLLLAGDRAAWLQVCGLCYANEHLTDGLISRHALPVVAPGVKGAERLAERLVEVGMWDEVEGGWCIHDYTLHQRSADEVRERRAKDAARKKAPDSAPTPRGIPTGLRADSARIEKKREDEKREEAKASSSAAGRADKEAGKASEQDRANCRLFAALAKERNPKVKVPKTATGAWAEWLKQMRLLRERDDNTPEEIERAIRWLFTDRSDDAAFWGSTIQAPSGLREHFAQVWAKMGATEHGSAAVESSASYLARRGAA